MSPFKWLKIRIDAKKDPFEALANAILQESLDQFNIFIIKLKYLQKKNKKEDKSLMSALNYMGIYYAFVECYYFMATEFSLSDQRNKDKNNDTFDSFSDKLLALVLKKIPTYALCNKKLSSTYQKQVSQADVLLLEEAYKKDLCWSRILELLLFHLKQVLSESEIELDVLNIYAQTALGNHMESSSNIEDLVNSVSYNFGGQGKDWNGISQWVTKAMAKQVNNLYK